MQDVQVVALDVHCRHGDMHFWHWEPTRMVPVGHTEQQLRVSALQQNPPTQDAHTAAELQCWHGYTHTLHTLYSSQQYPLGHANSQVDVVDAVCRYLQEEDDEHDRQQVEKFMQDVHGDWQAQHTVLDDASDMYSPLGHQATHVPLYRQQLVEHVVHTLVTVHTLQLVLHLVHTLL